MAGGFGKPVVLFEGASGIFLLALLGVYGWLALPVSLWLLGALVAHWLLRRATENLRAAREAGRRGLLRAATEIVTKSLSRSLAYVACGIFLVGLAQIGLQFMHKLVDPAQVRQAEEALSESLQLLHKVLDLQVLVVCLGGLLAMTLLVPRVGVMGPFLRLRAFLSKLVFMLLGATSFTFFGALDLDYLDPQWRQPAKWEAQNKLRAIEEGRRELAAAAWVESEVRQLNADKRQEFNQLFTRISGTSFPQEVTRAVAQELAQKAPKVTISTKPAPGSASAAAKAATNDDLILADKMQRYLSGGGGEMHVVDQPSLAELRRTSDQLTNHELRIMAARTAVLEATSEAIAEFVPKSEKALVNAFLQELTGAVSKGALKEVVPPARIADAGAAKEWVTSTMGKS